MTGQHVARAAVPLGWVAARVHLWGGGVHHVIGHHVARTGVPLGWVAAGLNVWVVGSTMYD